MQKLKASDQFIYFSNNLFSKQDVMRIFNMSYTTINYILNRVKLIIPTYTHIGTGCYFTWSQLVEFAVVTKLINANMKITELKRAKNKLQSIDYSLDLSNKSVIFAYGELFFIEEKETIKQLTQLTNLHKGEKTLLIAIVLSELEEEIDDKASKVIDLETYKHKKYFKPDKEILAKFA